MGASSSKSSSKPVDMTPQAFKNLQQPFANLLTDVMNSFNASGGAQALTQGYKGDLVAPITEGETQALDQLNQQTNGQNLNSLIQEGNSAENAAASVQKLGVGGDPNDPLLSAYIKAAQRPTQQALEETLSRTLPGRFALAGQQTQPQSSSAFDRAAAIATRGAADAMGDIGTKISYQDLAAGRDRTATAQQGAMDRSLTAQKQQVDQTVQNLQSQALPRLINDMGIERGIDAFNARMTALLGGLGIAGGTTTPVISTKSSSSSGGFNLK